MQLIRIMDKLWLKEGLDLKMVTFNCQPTGLKRGKCVNQLVLREVSVSTNWSEER